MNVESLEYTLKGEREEREREKLFYEKRIRELEQRVQEEGKRADALESEQTFLFNKHKETSDTLNQCRNQLSQDKQRLQIEASNLQTYCQQVEQEKLDLQNELDNTKLRHKQQVAQLTTENQGLIDSQSNIQRELERVQNELNVKQATILELEEENTQLKLASRGLKRDASHIDQDRMEKIIGEQTSSLRKLEANLAEKDAKLKKLTEERELVDILQEEKFRLDQKLQEMSEYRRQVIALELQVLELQEDRRKWSAFLEQNPVRAEGTDDASRLDSPTAIVRELMHQRVKNTSLADKVGQLEAELSGLREHPFRQEYEKLQTEKLQLEEKLNYEATQNIRLQRQIDLSSKELSLIKDQLKSYESEMAKTSTTDNEDGKSQLENKCSELEALVSRYKSELGDLNKQLSEREDTIIANSPLRGKASSFSTVSDEEKTVLRQSIRKLKSAAEEKDIEISQLRQELQVVKLQVSQSKVTQQRVLELRNNPTAQHEIVTKQMIEALRRENEHLLSGGGGNLPASSLDRLRLEEKELQKSVQELNKGNTRLKEVFAKKSLEFLNAVNDLLGYKIEPLPNRKVRAISIYSDEDNALTFERAKGNKFEIVQPTPMSGVEEFENHVTFWIKERQNIPCFLAALTLELYEKSHK